MPLGVAIGYVIPSFFVTSSDGNKGNEESAQTHIRNSLILQGILGTIVVILIIFFFREKPPTPPSASASVQKDPFGPSFKAIFRNKNLLLIMVVFALVCGVFNALGTVVGEFATRYEFTTVRLLDIA